MFLINNLTIFIKKIFKFVISIFYKKHEIVILGHLIDTLPIIEKENYVKRIKMYSHILPNYKELSFDALQSIKINNAGGRSDISEMYSIDLFIKKYEAYDFIFEKQVKYWIDYKMVDFICNIKKKRIGVSVTRAVGFPEDENFNLDNAYELLKKKINGLIIARNSVIEMHSFSSSILHIWCSNKKVARIISKTYGKMDLFECGSDLSLLVTICSDSKIYKNIFEMDEQIT